MRKLTKVLVLVAAFTALFALTAFAKTGWNSDENGWYFIGADGERIKDETRTSNGKVYYLDEETGYMVTNKAVEISDDLYYFGADGARVADQWISLPAAEDDESGEAERWYRFGSNGKAIKATAAKKVGSKYYGFDDEGRMLFGYVAEGEMINGNEDPILDCDHLYGDNTDGAMVEGWYEYVDGFVNKELETAWFYFTKKTGVKVTKDDGKQLIEKKYYNFDDNGIMTTGWAEASPAATASFWADNGALTKSGWVYAVNPDDEDDTNKYWFRLDGTNGYKNAAIANTVQAIKKKYYAFGANAGMVSGLVVLGSSDIRTAGLTGVSKATANNLWSEVKAGPTDLFYFDAADNAAGGANGWALNGSVEVDFNDATVTLVFDKYTFKAHHGLNKNDGCVYNHGQLQKSDNKYSIVKVKEDGEDKEYFVDGNGKKVVRAGKYANGDGDYYVVKADSEGNIRPKYLVPDGDYKYMDGSKEKYASAATVAKKLLANEWTGETSRITVYF